MQENLGRMANETETLVKQEFSIRLFARLYWRACTKFDKNDL